MNDLLNDYAALATMSKATGDGLRLEILRVLSSDAFGVMELCQIFDYKQSGMSHHLKVLAEAGLVTKRREGNSIFYSRMLPNKASPLFLLQQQLYQTIDEIALNQNRIGNLTQVKSERGALSQQFFSQHGDAFREQQDLIAAFDIYGESVKQLLINSALPALAKAAEVGPGDGQFLPFLATKFNRVTALDNSSTMLEQAKERCKKDRLKGIDFICGDTKTFHKQAQHYDCMVMNMVLHHTPSPADIFTDISTGLKENGVLIISELCRHDQDWARTACGDLWLGFDASELSQWAKNAGLSSGQSQYIALRNGFQIQLQQFIKAAAQPLDARC